MEKYDYYTQQVEMDLTTKEPYLFSSSPSPQHNAKKDMIAFDSAFFSSSPQNKFLG
jgi:hypothetical protein